jgi:hypothetical protein
MQSKYGSIEGYLAKAGVTTEMMDRIKKTLLVDKAGRL